MNAIFKNYGNGKRSDPQIISFNLTNKINLPMSDKFVALPNLSIYFKQKNRKSSYKNNKFRI